MLVGSCREWGLLEPLKGFLPTVVEMEQPSELIRVPNAVFGCNPQNDRMMAVHFQGKPFNVTVIQVYALTSNAEEAKVERFCEDLQDLPERTPKIDVLFILGDWNAKVGSKETPGVTGKFGLGVQNEAGQRLTDFLTMMVIRGVYLIAQQAK